ncbi:MAG: hypothetical protein Q9210_003296 [Variospora velana]
MSMRCRGGSIRGLLNSLYPFRRGLLQYLHAVSVVEVVQFCVAMNLELTDMEMERFANPAGRVAEEIPRFACLHVTGPTMFAFVGRDLQKPRDKIGRGQAWGSDYMTLLLLLGCPTTMQSRYTLQCYSPTLTALAQAYHCRLDEDGLMAVRMDALATIVYIVNPMRSDKWDDVNVLQLNNRLVQNLVGDESSGWVATHYSSQEHNGAGTDALWKTYRCLAEPRSFEVPRRFIDRRYVFYVFDMAFRPGEYPLLLFLTVLPESQTYRLTMQRWLRAWFRERGLRLRASLAAVGYLI